MRKQFIKYTALILIIGLIFTGCSKWIDTDLNVDPNSPSDVPMEYLLPSVQAAMAYNLGGNTAVRVTNIWMQYFDGVDRQSASQGRYNINSADVNDLWENSYAQPMMDATVIIEKAAAANSPHWSGIAKVCLALNLGTLTNLYGNMPYTEAFQGADNVLQPAYDTQEQIYSTVETLLDEAITELSSEDNAVAISGDLIYEGDVSMWIKAAYALKARYALYKGNYTDAISFANMSFESNDDNFLMYFDNSTSGANPIYQFMEQRTDIRMGAPFVNKLVDNGDPRLTYYVAMDDNGGYSGSDMGSENDAASFPGSYSAAIDAPAIFSTFAEMQFIKAEAYFAQSQNTDAYDALKAGVHASLLAVAGETDTAFVESVVGNIGDISLQTIIEQKYLAMYSTVVPFDDWRRTGFPVLSSVVDAISATPVRLPYPQSEITYNSNCPSGVTKLDGLWIFQ